MLLAQLGLPFQVVVPTIEEIVPDGMMPREAAAHLAMAKAHAVASGHEDALVIGSDTMVVLQEEILGKPASDQEAAVMLTRLQGRTHTVMTAVVVCHAVSARSWSHVDCAEVTMKRLTTTEIAAYVATGESRDKAGAYAAQGEGARLIAAVSGDFFAVVGLPVRATISLLEQAGLSVTANVDAIYSRGSRRPLHQRS